MSVLVEIVHRIEPGTPNRFADYVTRYGECAIPALERCGYDVLGAWKWSTGELFSDLVLARFDSLADYEVARSRAAVELRKGTFDSLAEFRPREKVRLAMTLPYGTEERLVAAFEASASVTEPRQFVYARLSTGIEHMEQVCAAMETNVGYARETTQLVTAYTFITGARGELINFWASSDGPMPMPWNENAPRMPDAYEAFYELVDCETVDYVNPLPYSRLR